MISFTKSCVLGAGIVALGYLNEHLSRINPREHYLITGIYFGAINSILGVTLAAEYSKAKLSGHPSPLRETFRAAKPIASLLAISALVHSVANFAISKMY